MVNAISFFFKLSIINKKHNVRAVSEVLFRAK